MFVRALMIGCFLAPALVCAQAGFPTEFAADAVPLQPDELQKRLTGRVAQMKYANGADVRLEFKDTYAFVNSGNNSDSGKWRVDGTKLCTEWQRFPSGCSEVRAKGDLLYVKRVMNGEIVQMVMK